MAQQLPPEPMDLRIEPIDNGFLVTKGKSRFYCKDEAELTAKIEKHLRFYARLVSKRSGR